MMMMIMKVYSPELPKTCVRYESLPAHRKRKCGRFFLVAAFALIRFCCSNPVIISILITMLEDVMSLSGTSLTLWSLPDSLASLEQTAADNFQSTVSCPLFSHLVTILSLNTTATHPHRVLYVDHSFSGLDINHKSESSHPYSILPWSQIFPRTCRPCKWEIYQPWILSSQWVACLASKPA